MNRFEIKESGLLGERYYVTRHASGLPIYIYPKRMSTTYAMLAVNFGSLDQIVDADGKPRLPGGIAHFLEHKLFENEDGSDSFERFSALGADANAYTAHSRTVYLFSCTDHLEEALSELLEFVTHPYFTEKTVKKEQGIITEEISMCIDDPYDRCYQNMLRGLYHTHPIREDICGSKQSIAAIDPQTLHLAYRSFYRPENMALVVCGDVTPEGVLEIAEAHLPCERVKGGLHRYAVAEPQTIASPKTVVRGQVAKPIFCIGVKDACPPRDARESARRDATMEILSEMLFSDTGELYNHMLDAALISPEFSHSYELTRDVGFFHLSGESEEPERVLEEVLAHLQKTREQGLSREDFEHYQRVMFAEFIKGFDSTEEIAENLTAFLFEGTELFSYADTLRDIRFEEVDALFRQFFDPARFTLSVVRPK